MFNFKLLALAIKDEIYRKAHLESLSESQMQAKIDEVVERNVREGKLYPETKVTAQEVMSYKVDLTLCTVQG